MSQYTKNPPLLETAVAIDPIEQFSLWTNDALAAGIIDPSAMMLATVGASGRPSARIVLHKGWHEGGLCFYTNFESRKGEDLAVNPFAAATFWWDKTERSVRFEGRIEKLSRAMSEAYFHTRPRGSQMGAHASSQSKTIDSRLALEKKLADVEARFGDAPIALPDYWGGYVLKPDHIEFWQGRDNRLHDRLCYRKKTDQNTWILERLQP